MGGRTGATCIPELISTYYGFDFYEQMIKSALGEETDFQQTESCPCMAKLLLSPVSGTITQIDRDQVERLRQEGLELVWIIRRGMKFLPWQMELTGSAM